MSYRPIRMVLFLFLIVMLGTLVSATTTIDDNQVNTTGNVSVGEKIIFEKNEGIFRNSSNEYTFADFLAQRSDASITSLINQAYIISKGFVTGTDIWAAIDGNVTALNTIISAVNDSIEDRTLNQSEADLLYLNLSGTNANQNVDIGIYNLTLGNKITFALGPIIEALTATSMGITGDLTVTGNIIAQNITADVVSVNELAFPNASIKSVLAHDLVNGTTYGVYMDGQTGTNKPTFWIIPGGPGQASGIVRSFMIVNEIDALQTTTNISSCQAWADEAGETLQIDCNTTTSGADLLVGDDSQFFGDVWIKDTDGQWHFLTRELQLSDELHENILFNRVNARIVGTDLVITSIIDETLVVNINSTETILDVNSDSITLSTGTNATPTFNYVTYQNPDNPTLTIDGLEPSVAHADVAKIYVGDSVNEIYMFDTHVAHNDEFINLVYERFDDAGAVYISGLDIGANATHFNITSGSVKIRLDEVTYTNNVDSASQNFFSINSSGNFIVGTPTDGFVQYSTGETVSNNKFFNIVVGVVPINQTTMRMMVIVQAKPSTEYGSLPGAEADIFSATNFFPNNKNLKKVFVPVFRAIIKEVPGDNEFQVLNNGLRFFDIRGQLTSSSGAPSSPPITNHDEFNNLEWNVAGHTFAAVGQVMNIGGYNLTTTGWINALFNWTVVSNYATFDGATLTINDALLNTNFNQTDLVLSINTTENFQALGFQNGSQINDSIDARSPAVVLNDGLFINYTTVKTTGNISNGTMTGYPYANVLCATEIPGSHMCTMGEILNTINQGVSNENFTATFRASEGAPGFVAEVSDCVGWTVSASGLGSIWVGSTSHANTYGNGALVSCGASRAIACCG